jgi:hypothetical protein
VFAARGQSELTSHSVPHPGRVAKALAGGQAPALLHRAPVAAQRSLDDALHAASVAGVQAAFLVAGLIGIVGGLVVLALVRPTGAQKAAAAAPREEPAVATQ